VIQHDIGYDRGMSPPTRKRSRASAAGDPAGTEPLNLGIGIGFMRLLWALEHNLAAASKRMEASVGVTGPQRLTVRIIGRFPGVSAGRLAELLHLHPSTLTGVLGRLVEGGLVQRAADPEDARRALFELTDAGRALDAMRLGTVEATVRSALARIPAAKIGVAEEVLRALTAALDSYGARRRVSRGAATARPGAAKSRSSRRRS
jgi:MarR family transcriptional regulator, organic hydroperoxide resistance regulator